MKVEEKFEVEISSVWKNLLGGMKRRYSEVESERNLSPKKVVKKRKTSDYVKDVKTSLSLLNWVTQNPNMTL